MRGYGRVNRCSCCRHAKDGRVHEKRFGEMILKEHLELLRPHACDGSVGLFCACEQTYEEDERDLDQHMVDSSQLMNRP